ncbi:DUF6809 family protein [Paenibacillus piscarius]|uniref:DUF6809 family protein n=1 Tax=Paenibacillus piscarius TaxID=1089681 RepID=UPI001EE7823D|nr:DUF6809 family protein [Paenibacillus piscarius]
MIIILEDFYYGKLRPNELNNTCNPEVQKIDQNIIELLQVLKERLPEEEFKQVEQLYDLQSDSNSLQSALSFIQGYKIGAIMMIEVFSGERESNHKGT